METENNPEVQPEDRAAQIPLDTIVRQGSITEKVPGISGLYFVKYKDENDHKWEPVAVFVACGILMVEDRHIGQLTLEDYHDNLNLLWAKGV